MSRSYDFPSLPFGRELLAALLPPGCAAAVAPLSSGEDDHLYFGRCAPCRTFHHDPLSDPLIPAGAVIAALVRRGWKPRVARRYVDYDILGRRYRHVPRGYGSPLSFRAWRRRVKVLVAADRADDITPWQYDRGYSYW